MTNISEQILEAGETEGEFRGQGVVRIWVRVPNGGAWPSGATVKFQEHTEKFVEETNPGYVDEPDPDGTGDAIFTQEEKKFFVLVPGAKYRLLASQTGFVALKDIYSDNAEIMV